MSVATYTASAYEFGSTDGGKCPLGYYCEAGTLHPTPCPMGTYGAAEQLVDTDGCTLCKPGFYCDELGLTEETLDARNKQCDAGYYCTEGALSPHPEDGTTGDKCPIGHYCPRQSSIQIECEAGFYETRIGSDECQVCPEGFYCPGPATTTPVECEQGYCAEGVAIWTVCPDGYYGDSTIVKMKNIDDCMICPEGKYCSDGVIKGDCSAGYFCDFKATAANDISKACPKGHYCDAGTNLPTRCDEGLYTLDLGSKSVKDCIPCQPGYYCIVNDSEMRACPTGHYCTAVTTDPTPCRKGQYQPDKYAYKSQQCIDCPIGFFCDSIGIEDYTLWPCPAGKYCTELAQITPPQQCGAGYYQPYSGMDSKDACQVCPAGFKCESGAAYPEPCDAGYTCPTTQNPDENGIMVDFIGSKLQFSCPPKTYCPAMSNSTLPCPEGFNCPSFRTDIYSKCTNGTYCPAESRFPVKCPAGHFGSSRTDNFDKNLGCIACGKGQYSDSGTNTCEDCWAGYVCVEAAQKPNPTDIEKDGGYMCPAGSYCPEASTTPIACPLAHYSDQPGNGFANQCNPCPENYFGVEVGATSCRKCQGATISDVGSTSCRCQGLNRKYLADKGLCVCRTGFEPVDGSSEYDEGLADCTEIIYETCSGNEVRDLDGKCRNVDDCSAECDGGEGQIQVGFGICQCNAVVSIDQICTDECLENQITMTFSANNTIVITNPNVNGTGEIQTKEVKLENTLGRMDCISKDQTKCTLDNIGMLDGEDGNFGTDLSLPAEIDDPNLAGLKQQLSNALYQQGYSIFIDDLFNDDSVEDLDDGEYESPFEDGEDDGQYVQNATSDKPFSFSNDFNRRRNLNSTGLRHLQGNEAVPAEEEATAEVTEPVSELSQANSNYISNPVVCKTLGSAILWNNLSPTKYPIYSKDSLLNTNDDFDFGEFTDLPEKLAQLPSNTAFVFTFTQPGVYVFSDSRNSIKQMIIAIMGLNQGCPSNSAFLPQSYSSLLKVGASQRDVLEPPDWQMFFVVLACGCILIILTTCIISYIVKRDWRQKNLPKIYYQESNYSQVERSSPEDKKAIVSINTEAESFTFRHMGREDDDDDEELHIQMNDDAQKLSKKRRKKRNATRDLQLPEVEDLKDRLQKHLIEIQKLVGRKYTNDIDAILSDEDEDVSSDDAEEQDALNTQIAELKRILGTNENILKGEENDDLNKETEGDLDGLTLENDGKKTTQEEKKKDQRETDAKAHQQELDNWRQQEDDKFEQNLEKKTEEVTIDINGKKNTVLQQQIASAHDRGTNLQHLLKKTGASGDEVEGLIGELQDKIQTVEDMMKQDEGRQNEILARKLDARRQKRKKLVEKLQEVEDKLVAKEAEKQVKMDAAIKEISAELKEDLATYEAEGELQKEELKQNYDIQKREKLSEFQDKLKNARSDKNFNEVLEEFQNAQLQVEKQLKKDFAKQNSKLENELKARRARRKNQAQLKKTEEFNKIEEQNAEQAAKDKEDRDKLMENLKAVDEDKGGFSTKLENQVNSNEALMDEMEHKRRDEEAYRMKHERQLRQIQGENAREALVENNDVTAEIQKLADGAVFDPFSAHVNERQRLQAEINNAGGETDRARLVAELDQVDANVRNQLAAQSKEQDKSLQDKLAARRAKRNKAIESEREHKQNQLQDRIQKALANSSDYQAKKQNMTRQAMDEMIQEMQMNLTPEEIPSAVERLIDDKHQKELEDLLLKLYEQKCVELKEEVLAMMEEKIAKQQELRKASSDRKRGIDAIISRTHEPKELEKLEQRKKDIDMKLDKELLEIENEYMRKEGLITREVQKRTQDREVNYIADLQEKQIAEKQEIFLTHLPDSLITTLNAQMGEEEAKNMAVLREQLTKQNAEKLAEMEAKQAELEANLARQQAELDKLGDLERQLLEKEARRERMDNLQARDNAHKMNSEDLVAKIRDEYEKGLEMLGGAMEEERKRQLDHIIYVTQERKARVEEARQAKADAEARKAEEARAEEEKEIDRIKALRVKKSQLEKTLAEGQRLIYKQCYSKPLYSFNKKLNELQLKNEDFAWLNEKKADSEFAKDIVTDLLHKITELEHKVTGDVRSDLFSKTAGGREDQSDMRSNVGSAFTRQRSTSSAIGVKKFAARDLIKNALKGKKARF